MRIRSENKPDETVILISTPGTNRYFDFYPGYKPLIWFLPRVQTVNLISTPGVNYIWTRLYKTEYIWLQMVTFRVLSHTKITLTNT